MTLMQRRRALMGGKKARLPAEYQQVEWIGSSGTQYIATGVSYSDADLRGHLKIYATLAIAENQTSSPQALFGFSNVGGYCIQRGANSDKIGPNGAITVVAGTLYDVVADWQSSKLSFTANQTIDNRNYTTSPNARQLQIMQWGYTSGSTSFVKGSLKLKKFTVEHDNSVVFDGVPCYRKSDGVIGLYDLVSESFKTNSGTGSFTKGADV